MILGPAPIRFQFRVEIQGINGWRQILCCNSFDRSIQIADAVAESESSMTRVVDLFHDRIIVHERVGPSPDYVDDHDWCDDPVFEEQVNWPKDGF